MPFYVSIIKHNDTQWSFYISGDTLITFFTLFINLELVAGATNLTLMGMNIRDGLKMTGKFRR